MLTDGAKIGVTVIVALAVAVAGATTQPELLVMMTLTVFPFARVELVNVLAVVLAAPCVLPFTNHSYVGAVPPLPGDAEKVTLVPAQIVLPGAAVIVTAGVTTVVTVITIALDVAVAGLAQFAVLAITTS